MATMSTQTLPYYDTGPLLSRNATFNLIVGARGLGKTYDAKKRTIRAYLNKGDQFIYLRRFKTELKGRGNYFADIAHEFPEVEFRVRGNVAEVCRNPLAAEKSREWEIMGWFAALSNAQTQKSVAYPNVRWILFDEFIIERGALRYLPDEVAAFLNFYSTVDRWKDKTRVLFMANSISIVNPYFLAWDIRPEKDVEYVTRNNGFVCAHFPESSQFSNEVYKTKFGSFIQNTEFGDYAVSSAFHDNHTSLIMSKNSEAIYWYTLTTKTGTFAVWRDSFTGIYYLQAKRPKLEVHYTTEPKLVTEQCMLLERTNGILGNLRSAYSTGRVFFDSPQTRESFIGSY